MVELVPDGLLQTLYAVQGDRVPSSSQELIHVLATKSKNETKIKIMKT